MEHQYRTVHGYDPRADRGSGNPYSLRNAAKRLGSYNYFTAMRKPRLASIDAVTRSAGAALLCSILTECLSSRQSELYSETLAWAMLPMVFTIARRNASNLSVPAPENTRPASASLWTVAFGVAAFCLFKAENGTVALSPALTPLLLVVQRYLVSEIPGSTMPDSLLFSRLASTVLGTSLTSLFVIASLSGWDLRGYSLSIIPVAALLIVYVALTPRTARSNDPLPPFDIEHAAGSLSRRLVVVFLIVLGVESVAFGLPRSNPLVTILQGLAKSLTWYFTVQTARNSSWRAATVMRTFSMVSTRNPFTQSSGLRASSHVIGAFLSLGQTIDILPKQAKSRSIVWAIFLIPLIPFIANVIAIRNWQSSLVHLQEHPVEALINNAKADFEGLLQRQSSTYSAAHAEYQRRYGIDPPPGFEAWYEFARSHESPIIDDFDMIYAGIASLLRLSGQEVLGIMSDAQNAPGSEMWLCTFSGHQATTHCSHPYLVVDRSIQSLFDKLLGDLRGVLPDVKFLVNHMDEPKVLISPARQDGHENGQFSLMDMSKRPAWDTLTKPCSQESSASTPTDQKETFGLPFVTDREQAMDLCRHPEYSTMHGLALSPTSFRPVEGPVPILSTGAPSTMGDILYPSPAYIEAEFQYVETHDVEWAQKRNNLYWAGSTTGGFARNDEWRGQHRQRFVELAQNLVRRQHSYLRENDGQISRVESSFLNSRLFDVAFTRIFQCERQACRNQRAYFNARSWESSDRGLGSRLVFDTDGNGVSGRYYKLLASRSVPLKQTLLREWHDERLVPWVHYVPVSLGMEELPELVSYLTSTEAGKERAGEIAEQGREWFSRAFRNVDLAVYTYRLMLELARLQDPTRTAY
ncbi:Glycosyltransferase family 90 protein [Aspergillus sp. HF37]|nr:Glycosyltransferase family 90 protein [Aspergillus sp. HF37]